MAVTKSILALVQLPPPMHGAAAVSRDIVTSALLRQHFNIVVIPIQLSVSREDLGGRSPRKFLAILRNVAKAAVALLRKRPALVYFALPPRGGGFYANLPLIAAVKAFRVPILYHFHAKGIRETAQSSGLYRCLFAWAMKGADVILLSERLYDDTAGFLPRERVHFLPNAVIPAVESPDDRGRDGRHILFLSNMIESKGPLVLLDALTELSRRGVAFHASFAGAPSGAVTRDYFLDEVEKRGLTESVRYHGPVAGMDKESLLRVADIFSLPSFFINEAFPLSILEAMNAGLAVVSTPEGAIADMVREGETGFLVPQRNAEKLADALQRLLTNPDLCRKMGQRGREIVTQEYALPVYHQRMRQLWQNLVNR